MKHTLEIAPGLKLPLGVATKRLAFLGTTGSGKTYGAMKLAEEMIEVGIQVIVLDVVGVWYGLRVAANGKAPGIQLSIFGGLHGDVPIEPTAGALIADLVTDRKISAVIDISQMDSDTDALKFARDFGKQIFMRHKQKPSAVMIFLEECQELIPEQPGSQFEIQCLHAWRRVVKIGRNFGLGIGMISQRPQEVSKKCLNLSECVFAFQMIGSQEREAMRKWIQSVRGDEKILDILPELEVGHPHVYSPRWLKVSGIYKISKRWTFDASSTPEVGGAKEAVVKPLSADDLKALTAKMSETIERAKADDPKELRRQLAERDKKIAQLGKAKPTPAAPAAVDPERPKKEFERGARSVKGELAKQLRAYRKACEERVGGASEVLARVAKVLEWGMGPIEETPAFPDLDAIIAEAGKFSPPPAPLARAAAAAAHAPSWDKHHSNGNSSIVGGLARKILTVLAQYPRGMGLDRLAILATSTVSGHFNNTLGSLRTSGYVTAARVIPIQITQEGLNAIGHYDPMPVGEGLRNYWVSRLGNGLGSKILQALIAQYPDTLSLEELASACDSTVSGHFNNTVGSLRTMGLMTPARTPIKASDYLFEE